MLTFLMAAALAATPTPNPDLSLSICRYALAQTAQENSKTMTEIVDKYIVTKKMNPADAKQQRAICAVYFLGAMDFVTLTSPRT